MRFLQLPLEAGFVIFVFIPERLDLDSARKNPFRPLSHDLFLATLPYPARKRSLFPTDRGTQEGCVG